MAEWRREILKKRHQIAVAYGGAMAAAIAMAVMEDMAARQKMADFFYFLSAVGVGLTRPNPTR